MRVLSVITLTLCAFASAQAAEPVLRDVVLVGSNWDGTAEIFDPHTFKVLKRIDVAPDREERLAEIANSGLKRRLVAWFVKTVIGEGHYQQVDGSLGEPDTGLTGVGGDRDRIAALYEALHQYRALLRVVFADQYRVGAVGH